MTSSIEIFSALLAFSAGNSPVTGEFPAQRQVTRNSVSLICAWINGWVNNREAGDLRHHRAHYDVTVMLVITLLADVTASNSAKASAGTVLTEKWDRFFFLSCIGFQWWHFCIGNVIQHSRRHPEKSHVTFEYQGGFVADFQHIVLFLSLDDFCDNGYFCSWFSQ